MDPKCVHHVEFGVQNGLKHVQQFLSQYKFRLAGTRVTPGSKQWLVCSHAVRFLITELSKDRTAIRNDPYVHSWALPTEYSSLPTRDSVFNVALRVKNIEGCVNRLLKQNVQIVKPLQTLSDDMGSVRACMIKSCIGNVVHTLVEDSNYTGLFLPGFQSSQSINKMSVDKMNEEPSNLSQAPSTVDLHHIDHVTFCIPCGSSASVINWYENCFGMKRFFINRDEGEDEGFVISGEDMGLRLKAFEYWKCAETGLASEAKAMGSVKFVIAEALPNQGPNQVDLFLKNHGGAGVQHIGLHTGDIIGAISQLQDNGVKFNEAPYTYYTEGSGNNFDISSLICEKLLRDTPLVTEMNSDSGDNKQEKPDFRKSVISSCGEMQPGTKVGRLKEMVAMGMNVELLQKNGILVDTEHDDDDDDHSSKSESEKKINSTSQPSSVRYLMQKFTRPLFDTDTFFLEVIQRVGATGFGSGNVTALWRSVQAYFRETGAEGTPNKSEKI